MAGYNDEHENEYALRARQAADDQALKPGCKIRFNSVYASDMDCTVCGRGEGEACPEYEASIFPHRRRTMTSPPMTDHADLIVKLLMPIGVAPPSDLDLPHLKGWNLAAQAYILAARERDREAADALTSLVRERDEARVYHEHFVAENEINKGRATAAEAEVSRLRAENEKMREAMLAIDTWAKAYPLTVFPEPDFVRARELLARGGITVDAVSASNMRHVLNGIAGLVSAALSNTSEGGKGE